MSPVKGGVAKGDFRDPSSNSRYSPGLLLPKRRVPLISNKPQVVFFLLQIYYTLHSPNTSCLLSTSSIPCRLPIFMSINHINSTRNHINSSRNHNITRQATVLALTYLGPSENEVFILITKKYMSDFCDLN